MNKVLQSIFRKIGFNEAYLKKKFPTDFQKLVDAIRAGKKEEATTIILTRNIDFREYSEEGENALHIAIWNDQLEVATLILENAKRHNIEDKTFQGDTALLLAAIKGNLAMT